MCTTCGCNDPKNSFTMASPDDHAHTHHSGETHAHGHSHGHHHHAHPHSHSVDSDHSHEHDESDHHHSEPTKIDVNMDILGQNNLLAQRNRGYFEAKNILSLNMMSAPGSGKTSLLERTIVDLKNEISFFIIEGDQQTMNDADRINATGAPVVQINTGSGCHLDADMVNQAVKKLKVTDHSVVIIENVGNLVCPSLFDLGESKRVVIISVTEGEDKPLKYPTMFQKADICIINKTDLLPYLDFKMDKVKEYALQVNHHLEFFEVSAKTGEGLSEWYHWLMKSKNAISEL